MHWFFLAARSIEIAFCITVILPLPLLLATIHRARVVHPIFRLFLTLFVVFLGASALMNTVAAVLSTIKESPDRLRSITVKLDVKYIGSVCQILACNFIVLTWLAFTFCSFERHISTRTPDRYDRRYRTREATVIAVCFFIPMAVILILLQYTKKTEIVFVAENVALFGLNLLLLLNHLCTESRLLSLPQTITKKFQVRQNIRMHQGFLRLCKHIICWGSGGLLVLIWATFVERNSTEYSYYEAIYFTSLAALSLLIVYLLFTESVLQPALRSFGISRWFLRKSSGSVPVTRISDATLAVTTQDLGTWRAK